MKSLFISEDGELVVAESIEEATSVYLLVTGLKESFHKVPDDMEITIQTDEPSESDVTKTAIAWAMGTDGSKYLAGNV
jgi:hypothetical protein